jgi:uncharacterized repeat protein (TIGR01451 family)
MHNAKCRVQNKGTNMKNIYKKIITLALSTLIVVGLAGTIFAENFTPVFNQKQGDLELFTGRNITKSQGVTSDPVVADPSDEVEGVIYYHNGIEGTTAKNVKVAVTLDQTLSTKSVVMNAKISADNAITVTDTVINGQVVGKSGLYVNLSSAAIPNFVPGSVRWFREAQATPSPLLNNQTGSELLTSNGLSIGDIQGCWVHSGFVMFRIKFVQPNPKIVKSKSAYNDTQKVDATKSIAKPDDVITYTLTTKNTGDADQLNYVAEDGVNDILDYAVVTATNGGTIVNQVTNPVRDNQVLIRYPAATIAKGATATNTFVVKVKNPLPINKADGYAFDGIMFNTYGNDVSITVTQPNCDASIVKMVRNISKSETGYFLNNTANPNDTLEYLITVKNIGNTAYSPKVKDVLPNGVTANNASIVAIYKGETVVGEGNLLGDGVILPKISPNDEIIVKVQVAVAANLADNTNLINNVNVQYCSLDKKASASTLVNTPVVPNPVIPVTPILPKTGPGLLGSVAVFMGSIAGVSVIKKRKSC